MAQSAVSRKGSFSVALSGGSTPKLLYSLLATDADLRAKVPWDKMHLFFGDERHVGPDDAQSNFKMASESMITKAPLKPEQVHRVKGANIPTLSGRPRNTNKICARISVLKTRSCLDWIWF
jgi:6-phosphogluconolactonase